MISTNDILTGKEQDTINYLNALGCGGIRVAANTVKGKHTVSGILPNGRQVRVTCFPAAITKVQVQRASKATAELSNKLADSLMALHFNTYLTCHIAKMVVFTNPISVSVLAPNADTKGHTYLFTHFNVEISPSMLENGL